MYGEIDTHTKKVHVKFVRNTHPTNQNDCENIANQRHKQSIDSTSQWRETGVRLSVTSKQRKPKKKNMQEEEPKFILLEGTIDEFIDEKENKEKTKKTKKKKKTCRKKSQNLFSWKEQ